MSSAAELTYSVYAIETHAVSKHFGGITALNRLSITIPRGQMTSIIGPNGSGKSTLINILTGIFPFDEGIVIVDGVSCRVVRPYEAPSRGLTRTFQDVRLYDQMSVIDNILLTLTTRNVFAALVERTRASYKEQAQRILESVRLWDRRYVLVMNLSYGQRKLLEVARALAMDVKIFLFDEPFAGLFPQMLEVVIALLQQLKRRSRTIVFIDHNMDIVRELSDHIIVLGSGSLVAEGSVADVLGRPEVIQTYLGT